MDVRAPFLADVLRRLTDAAGAQISVSRRVDDAGDEVLRLRMEATVDLTADEYVHLASALPTLHRRLMP